MSDLIVLAFDNEEGAMQMHDKLAQLEKKGSISLADAAVVVRPEEGKAQIKQLKTLTKGGAIGGGFLGMLVGLLFLAPWLGLAIGAISGAVVGKHTDIGVDDKFIKEVSETIEPGHSALFLLVYRLVEHEVMPAIEQYNATVLRTSLSAEDELKLREAFGSDA